MNLRNLFSWTWWNTPIEKIYCGNWQDYDAPRWYVYLVVPLGYLTMVAMLVFLLTRPGAFAMFLSHEQSATQVEK